jgi:hypothetical protein
LLINLINLVLGEGFLTPLYRSYSQFKFRCPHHWTHTHRENDDGRDHMALSLIETREETLERNKIRLQPETTAKQKAQRKMILVM